MSERPPPETPLDDAWRCIAGKDVADLLWRLKRVSASLGRAIANHDFADAHAEAGRLADAIEIFEKIHPQKTV